MEEFGGICGFSYKPFRSTVCDVNAPFYKVALRLPPRRTAGFIAGSWPECANDVSFRAQFPSIGVDMKHVVEREVSIQEYETVQLDPTQRSLRDLITQAVPAHRYVCPQSCAPYL